MCFEANGGASANCAPSGFNGKNEAPGYNKALVGISSGAALYHDHRASSVRGT